MSVCGTGPVEVKLSGFSWKRFRPYRLPRRVAVLSGSGSGVDLPAPFKAFRLKPGLPSPGTVLLASSPLRPQRGLRNINRIVIGIGLRLILSSRLTLIRLALIRNPWSFGGGASRPPCRYSFLHLLFHKLQSPSRNSFDAGGMLPYHKSAASADSLMPAYYPRTAARLVSCYALFE